jgi:hypothetical protein
MYNRIFLDSGAYSAAKKKEKLDVHEYIDFIKEHQDTFTVYANLDVIGDWEETWKNQRIMEKAGLNPLPVHHMEDPVKCLHWCLEYEYFALGGMAGASMRERIWFFDDSWEIICGKDGYPQSKVHGFGLASPELIYAYPWASIDSSSWVSYGRYGIVIVPRIRNGVLDYTIPPIKVFVTEKSPKKDIEGVHIHSFSPSEKEHFNLYLEKIQCPLGDEETEGVVNNNFWRDFCNYIFFAEMCKRTKSYPWKWTRKYKTLF